MLPNSALTINFCNKIYELNVALFFVCLSSLFCVFFDYLTNFIFFRFVFLQLIGWQEVSRPSTRGEIVAAMRRIRVSGIFVRKSLGFQHKFLLFAIFDSRIVLKIQIYVDFA